MRYLLDTHILLWARSAPERLSEDMLAILKSADNDFFVSVVTLWECAFPIARTHTELRRKFPLAGLAVEAA